MLNLQNFEIYEIQSEFCSAIANPKRLSILTEIEKKKVTVGELAKALDLSISNISQHLRILKNSEIVKSEKIGQKVFYTITDKRIFKICHAMRDVIFSLYEKRVDIFSESKKD